MTKLNSASLASVAVMTIFAGVVAIAQPARAHAAESDGPRSTKVEIADLDLATADGQKELDRRIRRAAREACSMTDVATGTRLQSREARACFDKAVRDAHVRFAARHGERTGG